MNEAAGSWNLGLVVGAPFKNSKGSRRENLELLG